MILYKSGLSEHITAGVKCRENVCASELTTYGLGGKIENCYFPKTPYQAKKIYSELSARGEKIVILGNGSNILASDSGVNCSVICLKEMYGIVRVRGDKLCCLAGTKISSILSYCLNNNLSGLEYMYGIPASVGGAAFMNAGIGNFTISRNIVSVNYFGDICGKISKKQCNFAYKQSTMRNINGLITSVTLQLKHSDRQTVLNEIEKYRSLRSHLPAGKSCGCVFKNGENYSAGELIDKAGLKGLSYGCAYVSPVHANFIINGGAGASDVKRLIGMVKERVFEHFGVVLQEEVVYIGDF